MIEIELKLLLRPEDAEALSRGAALGRLATGPATRRTLRSIYLDTPEEDLRRAGIALRLRKVGRGWVQTVKRAAAPMAGGLSTPEEAECPAPGGRVTLEDIPSATLRAAVLAAVGEAPLLPVFETEMARTTRPLAVGGAEIELALDRGVVRAGGREEEMAELELELRAGPPEALFEAARALCADPAGPVPVRLSEVSKAARGRALAAGRPAVPAPAAAFAVAPDYGPDATAEEAAAACLRSCLAQVAANAPACLVSDAPEAPHQLRVGLRRLRAALSLFRGVLGGPAADGLSARARDLAAAAGALRDLDVLATETLAPAADGPEAQGVAALRAAVEERRTAARAALRATLRTAETQAFLLDLAQFTTLRGWLDPADHRQTARLARPARRLAARAMTARWRKARRRAKGLERLDHDGRHALRKELKKLRYGTEFFAPPFARKRLKRFRRRAKGLQEAFGALQDLASAEALLCGDGAPAARDPDAQRAVGRLLGERAARAEAEWAHAARDWRALAAEPKFWD